MPTHRPHAVLQGHAIDETGLGLGFIVDDHPFHVGDLTLYRPLQLLAQPMSALQIGGAQQHVSLQEHVSPRVSPYHRLHLDNPGVGFDDSPDLCQRFSVERGIQQHLHAIDQQFPARLGDEGDNEQCRHAVNSEAQSAGRHGHEDDRAGKHVRLEVPRLGLEAGRIGLLRYPQLVPAVEKGDEHRQAYPSQHPPFGHHVRRRCLQGFLADLIASEKDEQGDDDGNHVLHLVQTKGKGFRLPLGEDQAYQHGHRAEDVNCGVGGTGSQGQAARRGNQPQLEYHQPDVYHQGVDAHPLQCGIHGHQPRTIFVPHLGQPML